MSAVRKSPVKKPRGAKTHSFSTSEGRANFAEALETTDREKTIVGFDRYRRLVAALVPIDAIRMLAGHGGSVDPDVRERIVQMARLFVMTIPISLADADGDVHAPKKDKPKRKKAKAKSKARSKALGKTT